MSFLALSGRESSLLQTFCKSCVHLDITHPSIHMTRRFGTQGCPPTLITKLYQKTLSKQSFSATKLKSFTAPIEPPPGYWPNCAVADIA